MKKILLFIALLAVTVSAQIGTWDTTGLIFGVNPIVLKNGDNPASANSGDFPLFIGPRATGNEYSILTNMASGYGYDSASGLIKHDGSDDATAISGLNFTITAASTFTYEIYAKNIGGRMVYLPNNTTCLRVIYTGGANISFGSLLGGGVDRVAVINSGALAAGTFYHIVCVKNGATLKIYLNGTEGTYSQQDSYNSANISVTDGAIANAFGTGSTMDVGFVNVYNVAFDSARVATSYANRANFYGLLGTDNGDSTMTITAPVTGPTIDSIPNDSVSHFGGTAVKIFGSSFTSSGTLVIGSDTVSTTSWAADSIKFTSPAHDTGTFNLIVYDSASASDTLTTYKFYLALSADSIDASTDSVGSTGGGSVKLWGTFGSTQGSVTIGGAAATVTNWYADSIRVTAPAKAAGGTAEIVVTDFNGYTAAFADSLYYYRIPVISSISPTHGSYTGGDTITITGTSFADSAASETVMFGDSTTTLVSYSNTEAVVVNKAGSGTVNVILTNMDGQKDTTIYVYDPAPTFTSIDPASGSRKLTQSVTITGTGFLGTQGTGYAAIEDADSTLTITSWSATSITGTRRTGTGGAQDVIVCNSNGDCVTGSGEFEFDSIPVITGLTPGRGKSGISVTITGVDFEALQGTVLFGDTEASSYTSWTDDEVVCVVPAGTGTVEVILVNGTGLADTTSFSYGSVNPLTSKNLYWGKTWMNWSRRLLRLQ